MSVTSVLIRQIQSFFLTIPQILVYFFQYPTHSLYLVDCGLKFYENRKELNEYQSPIKLSTLILIKISAKQSLNQASLIAEEEKKEKHKRSLCQHKGATLQSDIQTQPCACKACGPPQPTHMAGFDCWCGWLPAGGTSGAQRASIPRRAAARDPPRPARVHQRDVRGVAPALFRHCR
jgi:hypothetical protein